MATTDQTQDVIDVVQADHAEIKQLFGEVEAGGSTRAQAFQRLVTKLAVHETAEEEVVHPLARKAKGGDSIVEPRLVEEDQGKKLLADLEKAGVDSPTFTAKFAELRTAVLAHAEHEEQEEHPLIRREVDDNARQSAATTFRAAEKLAPTHAHANAPESAVGNMTVGLFVTVADRVRDALRGEHSRTGA